MTLQRVLPGEGEVDRGRDYLLACYVLTDFAMPHRVFCLQQALTDMMLLGEQLTDALVPLLHCPNCCNAV